MWPAARRFWSELRRLSGYNQKVISLTSSCMEAPAADPPSLLALARQGNAEAFCELCRVHENRLVRQATALCGDATLAQDLAQDTLVEAWKCLRRYDGRCQFFTWLCAILLNRCRNSRRQKRPIAFSSLAECDQHRVQGLLEDTADRGPGPDEMAAQAERAALLRECIEKLPPKHQEVIYLRFYVDHSLESIAAALGCSIGTVKSRLFYALDKLRMMDRVIAHIGEVQQKSDL